MINAVQIIVVIIALVIIKAALGSRTSQPSKAYKKLGLITLAILMVVAVLFPDTTNIVARSVGVGRGADLLLYITTVSFIIYVLNSYLERQDQHDMLVRLARRIAILEAKSSRGKKK